MNSFFQTVYKSSLTLLTDFYQLTMAYGYWKSGISERESVFHLYFRKNPFNSGFTLNSGLELAIDYLNQFRFTDDDLAYLRTIKGADDLVLFEEEFITYLKNMSFSCNVDAIPEGTVVFPYEPLLRISGPLLQCQLLETPLLNIINFHSLISTKAARVVSVAGPSQVLEFGLRRAQGVDGGLSASRAAFIGGCVATSNTLAGKIFGIPVRGTHSHSWVMAFDSEIESFFAFARAMPNNTIFLVDTYNSLEGVKKAIEVANWLKTQGKKMGGIRLDSGDLAYLSIEARKLLDKAGYPDAVIVASNDLDENVIASLKEQGAQIAVWGVGTQLVTAFDQPALGAVYKISAIKSSTGIWEHRIKLSEQSMKISTPGILQVRRFFNKSLFEADMIYDILNSDKLKSSMIIDPEDFTRFCKIPKNCDYEDLLVPVYRDGKLVYSLPKLSEIRERTFIQLRRLHASIRRLMNPHHYPAGLEKKLHDYKLNLIYKFKKKDLIDQGTPDLSIDM
ncbi:nicotinate phosphoribosyltransferase [Fluviispira multicolorata]|uniref:Nicotinate phosphoribosyltransferase n=1 Tax=Fluviispira multicolorata TaxID=2654512 RepID=A0A833JBX9_9BACT|nr:nicotinate phosphoribosyltransferase [Fluviispira multicolorata]KAB8028589.1 nicotinate phosphoribosyltransferase [Fluviispira multicolorata]